MISHKITSLNDTRFQDKMAMAGQDFWLDSILPFPKGDNIQQTTPPPHPQKEWMGSKPSNMVNERTKLAPCPALYILYTPPES